MKNYKTEISTDQVVKFSLMVVAVIGILLPSLKVFAQLVPFAFLNKAPVSLPGFPIEFTSNGTFVVPISCSTLNVKLWGGGGGSGGRIDVSNWVGGAGGNGGYVINSSLTVTPGETLNVYVGSGGAKGVGGSTTATSPRAGGAGGAGYTNGASGGQGRSSSSHIAGGGGGGGSSALVNSGSTALIVAGGGGGGGGGRQNRATCIGAGGAASGGAGVVGYAGTNYGGVCEFDPVAQAAFCPAATTEPSNGNGTTGGAGLDVASNGGSGGGGGGGGGYNGGRGGKGGNNYNTDASGGNAGTSYNGTFTVDTTYGAGGVAGGASVVNTDGSNGKVIILGCN